MNPGRLAPPVCNTQCQRRCQMAVVTATYQKCGSFTSWMWRKISGHENGRDTNWWHPHQQQKSKQQQGCWQQQGSQKQHDRQLLARDISNSPICLENLKKVAGKEARNMAVNVAMITKIWWPWKVPKWPCFLLGVAVKACRDLATLRNVHMCSNRSNWTPRSLDFSFSPIGSYYAVLYYWTRDSL